MSSIPAIDAKWPELLKASRVQTSAIAVACLLLIVVPSATYEWIEHRAIEGFVFPDPTPLDRLEREKSYRGWLKAYEDNSMSWKQFLDEVTNLNYAGVLIGLATVVLGALLNASLNRRRDDRIRNAEMIAVAAALYGEVLLLRQELARLAKIVARIHQYTAFDSKPTFKFDEYFLEEIKLSDPLLYKSLAPKIGILKPDLVIAITEFYKDFQVTKSALPLLVDRPGRPYDYGPAWVLRPACDAITKISPALRRIEALAHIQSSAPETLDTGDAEIVLELEEDLALSTH